MEVLNIRSFGPIVESGGRKGTGTGVGNGLGE